MEASAARACWIENPISTSFPRTCGGGEVERYGPFASVRRGVLFDDDDDDECFWFFGYGVHEYRAREEIVGRTYWR